MFHVKHYFAILQEIFSMFHVKHCFFYFLGNNSIYFPSVFTKNYFPGNNFYTIHKILFYVSRETLIKRRDYSFSSSVSSSSSSFSTKATVATF